MKYDEKIEERRKKELLMLLKSYKGIFDSELYDYLISLIGLELSAVNAMPFSEETQTNLNNLTLYKKILEFNVYKYFKKFVSNETKCW